MAAMLLAIRQKLKELQANAKNRYTIASIRDQKWIFIHFPRKFDSGKGTHHNVGRRQV
jgi:hypothetical protein